MEGARSFLLFVVGLILVFTIGAMISQHSLVSSCLEGWHGEWQQRADGQGNFVACVKD